ncbi:MAG: hypothetical protein H6673_07940 [Anaerolineales bacterium]|nr:hypothetical protein [Anaerolineales bacterium]
MRVLRVLLLVMLVASMPLASVHAQEGPTDVLQKVQDFFRSLYGRDFILMEYTYAVQTWTETSLGCPQAGIAYQQEEVRGYRWTLKVDNDETIYELHSNLDGSLVTLCTAIDRAALLKYRTFQNTEYLIDYPENWLVNATSTNAVISPSGSVDCNVPGLRLEYREPIGNANTMLDDVVREAGLVENMGVRTPLGDKALTLLYQGPCENNVVQYQAAAFADGMEGNGYLILQWTPINDYASWSAVYLHILASFRTADSTGGDTTIAAPPVNTTDPAQLMAGYPLATVFVQDVYIGAFDDIPGYAITIGSARVRSGLKFSNDGLYLTYIDPDPNTGAAWLGVAGLTLARNTVSRSITPNFTGAWSPAKLPIVAYLAPTETAGQLSVNTVEVTGSKTLTMLGVVPFTDSCETPAFTESERLYALESGPNGNKFTFEWLMDGRFLYTTNCDGTGLAIWNPADNSLVELGENLRRAVLSPDGTRVAAIDLSQAVYIIDLATGQLASMPLEYPADQLGWSWDGRKLYFSNLFGSDPFTLDDPSFETQAIETLGVFPYTSILNTVSLLEYDLGAGTETTLWQGQAYTIGRIVGAPNSAGVLFTVIPSDREYVLDFMQNAPLSTMRFARPETELYWLSAGGGEANLIAVTSQPTFAPAAPPATP